MTEIFDDIRKLYTFSKPCTELATYIEFFSETSVAATAQYIRTADFTVKLFPSFTPTIWFNLGSPYQLSNGTECRKIGAQSDILLLRDSTIERKNLPTDNIFTIKFKPCAFDVLFGMPQSRIGNQVFDVREIISVSLIEKLKNCSTFDDRIELLNLFFCEKLFQNRNTQIQSAYVNRAIERFYQSDMSAKNQTLADELYITEKTFYRYFTQTIGTNPKHFFSILRARTALTAYTQNQATFSPYNFGYYDFAHFSKDVVNFTGNALTSFTK